MSQHLGLCPRLPCTGVLPPLAAPARLMQNITYLHVRHPLAAIVLIDANNNSLCMRHPLAVHRFDRDANKLFISNLRIRPRFNVHTYYYLRTCAILVAIVLLDANTIDSRVSAVDAQIILHRCNR
jgi:hypothetical protein